MIRFNLFGISIEIQPWFWLSGALIGGARNAGTREGFLYMIVFMVIMTISIIVHELGHALTGRRLGGGAASITLWAFGGLAQNRGGRFTRNQRFWMILMGPGAGFLLLLTVILILFGVFGLQGGFGLASFAAIGRTIVEPTAQIIEFVDPGNPRWWMVRTFIWINFWWGLINLLPVLPLDGGQIADIWVTPQSRMYLLSTITGALMAAFGLFFMGSLWVGILFGFLAYQSYQRYQGNRWR